MREKLEQVKQRLVAAAAAAIEAALSAEVIERLPNAQISPHHYPHPLYASF